MSGEFELIKDYFAKQQLNRNDVAFGLGDDCAILTPPQGMQIAISTDSCVAGTHFLIDADPRLIAHKTLASNLSDLAAMGATPAWLSLALTLPKAAEFENQTGLSIQDWLGQFCQGMFELANAYHLQLIGGDTTSGPLNIGFTIHGFIPQGQALYRHGAKAGDLICVSGDLGAAGAGLEVILNQAKQVKDHTLTELEARLAKRHFDASPRVALGEALRGLATSCIDISDGLVADLAHILKASKLGAQINLQDLPIAPDVLGFYQVSQSDKSLNNLDANHQKALQMALTSGEEYEICFTISAQDFDKIQTIATKTNTPIACIGQCTQNAAPNIELFLNQQKLDWQLAGFDHFRT